MSVLGELRDLRESGCWACGEGLASDLVDVCDLAIKAIEERDAAIRRWDKASTDWQRRVGHATELHAAEARLRELARGEQ